LMKRVLDDVSTFWKKQMGQLQLNPLTQSIDIPARTYSGYRPTHQGPTSLSFSG
jgi:hypothetical protein